MSYIPPKSYQVRLDDFTSPPNRASLGELRQDSSGIIWICVDPLAPTWRVVLSVKAVTS